MFSLNLHFIVDQSKNALDDATIKAYHKWGEFFGAAVKQLTL
jgi:hypothetical protein